MLGGIDHPIEATALLTVQQRRRLAKYGGGVYPVASHDEGQPHRSGEERPCVPPPSAAAPAASGAVRGTVTPSITVMLEGLRIAFRRARALGGWPRGGGG